MVVVYPGPITRATKRRTEEARRQAENDAMLATKEIQVDKEVMTNVETRDAAVRTSECTAHATTNVAEEVRISKPDEDDPTGERSTKKMSE
ncbi:hypothetical protein GN244_ATG17513 [Phytophthora infestans]|uniref:Uncharacterized protein n=1 Tax=Phytophthora infestans TaxID=4787 RepID=A0A833SSB5_PHYIN|nr:hypothetical protein GN244_ATG17513 [Phytophthora infestans]KAF4130482.1 hypothetical protein GN958_ATG20376 [Phytophthora infestans]